MFRVLLFFYCNCSKIIFINFVSLARDTQFWGGSDWVILEQCSTETKPSISYTQYLFTHLKDFQSFFSPVLKNKVGIFFNVINTAAKGRDQQITEHQKNNQYSLTLTRAFLICWLLNYFYLLSELHVWTRLLISTHY